MRETKAIYMNGGYREVWFTDGTRQLEHRYIMELFLGRTLGPDEIVHHIDHDKTNNVITNLQLMTRSAHASEHGAENKVPLIELICPVCSAVFLKKAKRVRHVLKSGTRMFCSRKCSGAFSTRLRAWRPMVDRGGLEPPTS